MRSWCLGRDSEGWLRSMQYVQLEKPAGPQRVRHRCYVEERILAAERKVPLQDF